MQAIKTVYKRHKFRSRREARWAVVLDTLGIKWEYEAEGYAFDDGTCYLPDFLCRDLLLWVEVKPTLDIFIGITEETPALHKARLLAVNSLCPVAIVGEIEDRVYYCCPNSRDTGFWPNFFAEYWGTALVDEALRRGKQARFER